MHATRQPSRLSRTHIITARPTQPRAIYACALQPCHITVSILALQNQHFCAPQHKRCLDTVFFRMGNRIPPPSCMHSCCLANTPPKMVMAALTASPEAALLLRVCRIPACHSSATLDAPWGSGKSTSAFSMHRSCRCCQTTWSSRTLQMAPCSTSSVSMGPTLRPHQP